ncbi:MULTISPECIES: putative quinol monooxygenase [Streptosporangium]|uniref:Quinol monooxygenase YgiN n=1 Tax=Streptosporangium brasiliense TaxID=47480 RepID=A0ABT9R8S2_9ACTN|nr:putative quinol monooxygenase [Streptosporangium brasiliense]MDP9865621.1 quinol monooxygenase YgiN [Streptosporangium brasiliense]
MTDTTARTDQARHATTGTISLYGFARPRPERAAELRELLLSFVEPTRQEAGSLEYHVHEEADGSFFLYEVWRSQEDLDRHMELPHMKDFWERRMDYLERELDAHSGAMLSPYPR